MSTKVVVHLPSVVEGASRSFSLSDNLVAHKTSVVVQKRTVDSRPKKVLD